MHPGNRNIFIMTDDPKWLEQALLDFHEKNQDTAHKDFRFFTLASNRHQIPKHSAQFESNIDLWASIEVARQCSGLVIHSGSAIGILIGRALCYRHRDRYVSCPSLFDISGGAIDFSKEKDNF
jgi:hypothetical protein